MSEEYKFNFQGLSKFIDDFKYLNKKGGSPILTGGGLTDILDLIVNITKGLLFLCFFCLIIYSLYIIIFKGYPRWVVDLLMFRLFHKEDVHGILKDNLIYLHIEYLTNGNNCIFPMNTFNILFDKNLDLNNSLKNIQKDAINPSNNYVLRGNGNIKQMYQLMFFDYYNNNVTLTDASSVDIVPDPNIKNANNHSVHRQVPYAKFYHSQVLIQLKDGIITDKNVDGTKKGADELLWTVYQNDVNNKNNLLKASLQTNVNIALTSGITKTITDVIKEYPISAFILLPQSDVDISQVTVQLTNKLTEIENGAIFDHDSSYLSNEYSWFIVEILNYFHHPTDRISVFKDKLPYYNSDESATIRYYLTLTKDKRGLAKSKIFNRKFQKKAPGVADFGQDCTYDKNDPCNTHCQSTYSTPTSDAFLDYIRKYPILSNLYFSGYDIEKLYPKIMETYINLISDNKALDIHQLDVNTILKNLQSNGMIFKDFINSVNILNLYLNEYVMPFNQLINDQNIDGKTFFTRLFSPYKDDILRNRMGSYYDKVFSMYTWNKSYNLFRIQWKKIGDMLKAIISSIWRSFFTSSNVDNPQAV